MSLTVRPVESTHTAQVWPQVEGFIREAFELGMEAPPETWSYSVEHVQAFLASNQWLLLVAIDEQGVIHGAATVSFINFPRHRIAFITAIGGKLIANRDTFAQLKAVLKRYGATKIQGYGRESIVRLWKRFGFEPRTTLMETLI